MWRIGYCGFTIMGVIDFPLDRIWKLKTVWISRNNKVFEKLVTTLDALLFHFKMRALMIKFNVAGVVMNEIAACGGVLKVVLALFSDWLKYRSLQPWSFRNLFANIEGSLRRMAKVRIEVTNRGKNGMAKALAKAVLLGNTLFRAYWETSLEFAVFLVVCALFWYSLAVFDSLPELG
ncbi:hypothetical protein Gohar_021862 [Gossypium harknessii]|uniref:RNase H type-1 domain-containing protein n=1 Tax=Gossypium harknessii TaxID=34285 RepID=A0A7J9IBR7_9ROSI|nr:hypothetical protein [Gossypium harknessii]